MKRFFVSNLLLLVFVNLLIKPFWVFGIDRVVQIKMGTAEYGTYFSILNFSILFSILTDFGIQNFNTKSIAGSNTLASKYFSNLFMLKAILSTIYFLFTLVVAYFIGYSSQYILILSILCVSQILLSYVLFFRSTITGFRQFKQEALLSVLDKLLMICFASTLLIGWFFKAKLNIISYSLIQLIAYFITFIVSFILIKRLKFPLFKQINTKIIRVMIRQSWPYALIALMMTIYYRIDGLLLERICGPSEAGIYAKSYRIYDAINNFSYLFSVVLLPIFSIILKKKENFKPLLNLALGVLFTVSIPTVLICFFYSESIMHLFYKSSNDNVFHIIMFAIIPIGSIYIVGSFLVAAGKIKLLNKIVFVGVLCNLLLNAILIPKFGAQGAAIACICTQLLMGVLHFLALSKIFPNAFKMSLFVKSGLYSLILIIVSVTTLNFSTLMPNVWINMIIILCFAFVASILLRLFPTKGWLSQFKMKDSQ